MNFRVFVTAVILTALPCVAFSDNTAITFGVNRTVSPSQVCVYDTTNTCQPWMTLPASGGPALAITAVGSITGLGTGVATALANAANAVGGFPAVNGVITTGDCLQWGPGVQDAGATCGTGSGSSGTVIQSDALTVTATNTLSSLSKTPVAGLVTIYINGVAYNNVGASPPFTYSGTTVTWSPTNSGINLATTDTAAAVYTISNAGLTFPQTVTGGVSGAIPYFSSTTVLSVSGLLAANALMVGGGAGAAPSTVTTGNGVLTALGVAPNASGAFATVNGTIVANDCLQWSTTYGITDAGGACGSGGGGSGTVTSVSVVSANGFAGTVATATTTPAITLTTSITGVLKGNGTAISAATAGTDYLAPTGSGAALTGITTTVGNATSDTSLTIAGTGAGPYTGAVTVKINLANAQTWTAAQTFATSDLVINGGSATAGLATVTSAGVVSSAAQATLAQGGTNASLTASNGGIVYSTASALAVLAGTGTAGQCLLSGSSAAPSWGSCSGAAAVSSVSNSDGTLTISPTTGAVVASLALGHANTWTAAQTYTGASPQIILGVAGTTAGGVQFLNATSGSITLAPATGALGTVTVSIPAITDTLVTLTATQTLTNKSIAASEINSGTLAVAQGGTGQGSALTQYGVVYASTTTAMATTAAGTTSGVLQGNAAGAPTWVTTLSSTIQGNITALGVIATGTWQGTLIGATYGGTGVNNGSATLTLAASLTTTGTGAPTLAFPATTLYTYTYPANSGTLAELGFAQSWTAVQTFATGDLAINGGTATAGVATASSAGVISSEAQVTLAQGGTNASLTASNGGIFYSTASAGAILAGTGTSGQCLLSGSNAAPTWGSCGSLTISFPQTVAGTTTSGGVPYFSSTTVLSSSAALASNAIVIGGGAGTAPSTTTTGTGVLTAIASSVNTTGGLGTIGTSGATVGLLNGANTWSAAQTFATSDLVINGGTATAGVATVTSAGVVSSVAFAAASDVRTGTDTTKPVNASALSGSAAQQTVTETSNAATVTWTSGYNARVTLNGNLTTLTLSSPSDGICYTLRVVQPASGGPYTVTWPSSVDWGTAGTPTLTTTASKTDLATLCYDSSASKYDATVALGF